MKNLISSTITILLILSGCQEKQKNKKAIDKNNKQKNQTELANPYQKIKSFMFLHKGMRLSEVIEYLNKNSISHSKPIILKDCVWDYQINPEIFNEPYKWKNRSN